MSKQSIKCVVWDLDNTVWAEEFYRIAKGRPVPGPDGYETDLFAGVG